MFEFITKITIVLAIFFEQTKARIHLSRENLAKLCGCDPSQSISIYLGLKSILTINPNTFDGLTSLQELTLSSNKIDSIDPTTFNGLTSLNRLYLYDNSVR